MAQCGEAASLAVELCKHAAGVELCMHAAGAGLDLVPIRAASATLKLRLMLAEGLPGKLLLNARMPSMAATHC